MDAKNLMIGDKISVLARFIETSMHGNATSATYTLCRKICRVCGLNDNSIAIDKVCNEVISYDPIPLTKEILNKNGWKEVRKCVYKKTFEENIKGKRNQYYIPYCVCISDAYIHEKIFPTTSEDVIIAMQYVHELQHMLRTCGLYGMADNIVV